MQIMNDVIMRMLNLEKNNKILQLIKLNISEYSWRIGDNSNHFFSKEVNFDKKLDLIAITPENTEKIACIWLKAASDGIIIIQIRSIDGEKLDSTGFDTIINCFIEDCIKRINVCSDVNIEMDVTNDFPIKLDIF